MATVTYHRVITSDDQYKEDLQRVDEPFDNIFEDEFDATKVGRPQLQAMINFIQDGDTVVVRSIDRLASSLADLELLINQINDKGCSVEFREESLFFRGGEDFIRSLNRVSHTRNNDQKIAR